MEEVTGEPLYRDRVCGIDIGKAQMAATIRVPSDRDPSRRAAETRMFGTTKREVLALADWLRCWQVPAVVMEATGDYWKPIFYRLEAEGLECVLADPKQVRNLPGRPKRDPSDSAWLAACFERGTVTSCFVATPEFRIIREHTRYRRDLTEDRTREKNRAEKLLESAAVKLSSVLTDLHGVTGRDIMDQLIAGQRDPKALAQLARARARRKIGELEQALEGAEFLTPELAALLRVMLERIDRINEEIARLSQVIERLLAPYEEQLQQAESMPGWGRRAAQDAIAETGVDMSRFPTPGHLASWAGRTPLEHQSGKRAGPARRKHGNRYLGAITGETAVAAGKTDTREGARHRRLARRRGKAKACVATGNTQMRVYHALLSRPGSRYQDLGPDYYERQRDTARQVSHHVGKLASLGYEVTLCKRPEPDETGPSQPA
ncbi:IS110 family transposase [Trebonia kvetii]|uniref:IS110 family transposase n=1 Tax=Trebonia kvetii TaxID=2480626 RepID=A0A6P2BQ95_9ACTN|nr:IS110 family transposase [Trebonia kvetii]TVZ01174.1 IS110 family transposase [Trebonia kvetii]